jgi:HlyD family secretion protein
MKKNLIIGAGVIVVLLVGYFIVKGNKSSEVSDIMATVKRGPFKVEIETTGELEAKNSVKILGPSSLRDFRIWQVTIQNIIDEGTVVKKGDWVATLDRSEFQNRFNEKQIELEKANSKFIQTQLDTTLQLRQARDELINLKYGVDEKQIILEQSKFEPPATIKQAEINLDKAIRSYDQALENYKIKKNQNIEKMREVSAELRKVKNEFDAMTKVLQSFSVLAPEDGMVIYEKGWDGKAIKAGSQINMWEPTVATLPDLTKMLSKTYVNEVDVRKVKSGQKVEIGLDAYPEKKLSGQVMRVANVGEQRPNSDAKVFEVSVEINGTDPTLRPSMTTSNKIVASMKDSALYIPLESLHSHFDTITYVYKKDGIKITKQEVIVGETNANDAIVKSGLQEGDRIYLSVPEGQDDKDFILLKEMDGKRQKRNPDEEKPGDKLEPKVTTEPSAKVEAKETKAVRKKG